MPEPTPTTRELALRALDNTPLGALSRSAYLILRDQVEAVVVEARREGREEGLREAQVGPLADHDCEPVVDLSHCFGEGRECRLGRLTRAPEGWEHETWCLHLRSPLKGEVIFLLNEGDFCAGAALAYAALGYHVNPEWVESVAAGKGWDHYEVGCYPKSPTAPEGAEE